MPRPTNAQVAYGTLTVVLFTLVMLLLTDARSGAGVVVISAGGLVLGLLVATGVAAQNRRTAATAAHLAGAPLTSMAAMPRTRVRVRTGAAEQRLSEHSLRR